MARTKQGQCPKCGSLDIAYGNTVAEDDDIGYEGCCNDCDCNFTEWYTLAYVESIIFDE